MPLSKRGSVFGTDNGPIKAPKHIGRGPMLLRDRGQKYWVDDLD